MKWNRKITAVGPPAPRPPLLSAASSPGALAPALPGHRRCGNVLRERGQGPGDVPATVSSGWGRGPTTGPGTPVCAPPPKARRPGLSPWITCFCRVRKRAKAAQVLALPCSAVMGTRGLPSSRPDDSVQTGEHRCVHGLPHLHGLLGDCLPSPGREHSVSRAPGSTWSGVCFCPPASACAAGNPVRAAHCAARGWDPTLSRWATAPPGSLSPHVWVAAATVPEPGRRTVSCGSRQGCSHCSLGTGCAAGPRGLPVGTARRRGCRGHTSAARSSHRDVCSRWWLCESADVPGCPGQRVVPALGLGRGQRYLVTAEPWVGTFRRLTLGRSDGGTGWW